MKYRTQMVSRTVPHTIDGETRDVTITEKVQVPVVPRDWDRIVLRGVSGIAVLILAAAVAWSTASIGALLALVVTPPVAYTAAAVFDLAWITALAVEWLSRYNTRRAVLPRRVGYVALGVAMGAVCAHGWIAGSVAVGIVGAVISGLAKVVWTLVLHHNAKPLDDRTQQFVDQRSTEVGARMAMIAISRQLARAEEGLPETVPVITTAEEQPALHDEAPDAVKGNAVERQAALPEHVARPLAASAEAPRAPGAVAPVSAAPGEAAGKHHEAPPEAPGEASTALHLVGLSKAAAVRTLHGALPDASPEQIALQLTLHGITADTAYIRTVLARQSKKTDRPAPEPPRNAETEPPIGGYL